jgi:hypothetical protein
MKRNYDKKKGDSWEYAPGDKVWLEGTNITTDRPIKKLDDKRHGPFIVDKKVGESSYRLKLPATWKKIHATFNEKYLSPFIPAQFPSQKQPDPPPPIQYMLIYLYTIIQQLLQICGVHTTASCKGILYYHCQQL